MHSTVSMTFINYFEVVNENQSLVEYGAMPAGK